MFIELVNQTFEKRKVVPAAEKINIFMSIGADYTGDKNV
jgi:hypothetical protein